MSATTEQNPPPKGEKTQRIIVFLGPSMPLDEARSLLAADYRPPIRRGDLAELGRGDVVGIVDGEIGASKTIQVREIIFALERGVRIYGSSGIGALRAGDLPEMIGVGKIADWYRLGQLRRDDEVALTYNLPTYAPTTVALARPSGRI